MAFRPVGPPPRQRPPGLGRRLLGGPDSWRRVALTGLGGGLAVAAVAAVAAALVDGRGGAVDEATPTPPAPVAAPIDNEAAQEVPPPAEEAPVEAPPAEEQAPPVELPPTEAPAPVEEQPTEAPPTEAPPTPVVEEPTVQPTVAEGGSATE